MVRHVVTQWFVLSLCIALGVLISDTVVHFVEQSSDSFGLLGFRQRQRGDHRQCGGEFTQSLRFVMILRLAGTSAGTSGIVS